MWWLKLIGESDDYPLLAGVPVFEPPPRGLGVESDECLFPKGRFPGRLDTGDLLVYYAVGGEKSVFAIAQALGPAERDKYAGSPNRALRRWCHAAPVRIRSDERLDDLRFAPKLARITARIDPSRGDLAKQSHLPLHKEEFDLARSAIRDGARRCRAAKP